MKRIVAHLDMDAFFASIEEADNPHFKGMPIAVGSDPRNGEGRGVISTANYKAREYGIHSALPVSKAWQLSEKAVAEGKPEVVFLPVNFERYREVSAKIFEIIKKYAKLVEPASIDEFYFSLDFAKNYKEAEKICQKIKKEIKEKIKVTCSVGIGGNKLIAKIAAGIEKPDGMTIVNEKDSEKFLEPLSVREIPGIGPKTELLLNSENVKIVKDLKKISKEKLKEMLGKWGEDLYSKARGIDESLIVEDREAKSIGEQATFQHDTLEAAYIGEAFENLCKNVFLRFKESGFKTFRTIAITVRFSGFETKTSAKTLKNPTASEKDFKLEALKLLLPYLDKRKNPELKSIRLIGVRVEKFDVEKLTLGI
jgi:DNA polymerase IV (DinB-like DNA polymerase)